MRGLCTPGERIVFACATARRSVAVCAGQAGLRYRSGRAGRIELASPAGSAGLSYANRAYSGGGEAQVSFVNGRYGYTVYSNTIRTGFGPDGRNDPQFGAGVLVAKDRRVIAHERCVTPADADLDLNLAMKRLPEGTFVEHD